MHIAFVITFVTILAAGAAAPIRFELIGESGVVVPISIDGRGPFRFLVDTGASHSAVSSALAGRLALRPVARTLVTTPTGQTWRPVVRLRGASVGGVALDEIRPSIAGGAYLHDVMRVDGVLGQDVLAPRHYTLDYRQRALTWGGPASEGHQITLPLEWHEGTPIVRAVWAGGGTLRLVADTGASHIVLFGTRFAPVLPGDSFARLDSAERARMVRQVIFPRLHLGAVVLPEQPGAVIESDAVNGADGVLPLHLFQRVTFNGPGRYLAIDPW